MSDSTQRPRRSKAKNTFTTSSGKTIKLNRSFTDRVRASREAKAQRKAAYLSTLPKEPWKRLLYRMHPKRLIKYWFSRDGAIMALKLTGIGFVVVFLLIVGLFAYFRKDLPKIKDLNSANSGGSIAYYDRTGKTLLFQDFDTFKRIPVSNASEISPYMKQATIAVEDKDFYHEGAFNVRGITRAAFNNLSGGSTQGGSTITQQLVKLNENWTNDHTVSRKVKELILAVELEREYSKDDILTAYLNSAPYSGLDSGVQAAAKDMFNVDAKNLSLPQATMLAAIPKAPGTYSPYNSPQFNPGLTASTFDKADLLSRQQYILDQMAKQGYINQSQADAAKKVDVVAQVQPRPSDHYAGIQYPYFVQSAKDELRRDFPAGVISSGGLKVITTVDTGMQNLADKTIQDNRTNLKRYDANDAAFVAEDNVTGQVMALVGGTDFNSQRVNFASQADISPGSSIKPYTYTTLINNNNNVGAGSVLYDTQGVLPGYPCTNKNSPDNKQDPGNCLFDDTRKYNGPVTLRYALGSSLNVPAVKAFLSTNPNDHTSLKTDRTPSINKTISTANALIDNSDGYKCYPGGTILSEATKDDEIQCGAAAGIGDGAYLTLANHVNGIASISRLGQAIPQTFLLQVTNASGKILKKFTQPVAKQVVRPDAAYIVSNMAADPGASYLSGHCTTITCTGFKFHRYKGWENAIKTGTTNDQTDGLMMSWNKRITAGVWVGNYDRSPYTGSPEYMTDPIMSTFMKGAIDSFGNVQPDNWKQPSDIKTLSAYHSVVPFSTQSSPPATDLYPSWYVGRSSSSTTTSATIDRVSGKLATSCTPDLARRSSYNANAASWNVDLFMGGNPNGTTTATPTTTQGNDDVHSCSDAQPTVTITAVNNTSTTGSTVPTCPTSGCVVMVHVEQGTHPLNDSNYPSYPGTINLTVNGQTVQTQQVSNTGDYQFTYTPPAGTNGSIQIQAQVIDSVLYQGTDTKTINVSDSNKKTSFIPGIAAGNDPKLNQQPAQVIG